MRLLYFMFGFVIASLVWSLVLMRVLDYDIKAFTDTHKLFKEFSKADMDSHKNEHEFLESLSDFVQQIRNENHEFKMEVLNLVENDHEFFKRWSEK